MDQLINQIVQQTGISQSQAQQAVQLVLNFAKGRLPGPLASQLESALGGNANASQQNQGGIQGMANQAQQALGGFGQQQ